MPQNWGPWLEKVSWCLAEPQWHRWETEISDQPECIAEVINAQLFTSLLQTHTADWKFQSGHIHLANNDKRCYRRRKKFQLRIQPRAWGQQAPRFWPQSASQSHKSSTTSSRISFICACHYWNMVSRQSLNPLAKGIVPAYFIPPCCSRCPVICNNWYFLTSVLWASAFRVGIDWSHLALESTFELEQ